MLLFLIILFNPLIALISYFYCYHFVFKATPTYLQWNFYEVSTIVFVTTRKDTYSWDYEKNAVSRFKGEDSLFNSQINKFRFHPKVLKVAFAHDNGTISIVFLNSEF